MTKQKRIEHNRKFVGRCIEYMIKYIKTEVPEKGKFQAQSFCYEEPVSKNNEQLIITPDLLDAENSRRLMIAVSVGDSGYQVENYMKTGSNSEIIEYLQQDGIAEELLERIMELDERAEDKKGEYPFY